MSTFLGTIPVDPGFGFAARRICDTTKADMKYLPILPLLLLIATGCSSKQVYDFGSELGKNLADCEALTSVPERADCESARGMSYEEYQRERADILAGSSNGKR